MLSAQKAARLTSSRLRVWLMLSMQFRPAAALVGGQAFQCGTVVSADGTNLVVPCTLDNILIVRNFPPNRSNIAYLLNANLLVADGMKIQLVSNSSNSNIINIGIETFLITKENGQTTFTQTKSKEFNGEYCYIAWDNAE